MPMSAKDEDDRSEDEELFEAIEQKRRRLSESYRWRDRSAMSDPIRPKVVPMAPDPQASMFAHTAGILAGGDEYLSKLRRMGPFKCRSCGERTCEFPGICSQCAEADQASQKQRAVTHALRTLPEAWRWADFREPTLFKRVSDRESIKAAMHKLKLLLLGSAWLSVLAGESGEGKTSLAAAMMRACARRHPDRMMLFVYAPRIARAYRNSPLGKTPELIDQCERAWLLVIDDLGADAVYRDSLREVIQIREAERKPTIITTYLTEDETKDAYGGGISRRMFRDGEIIWVGGGRQDDPLRGLQGPVSGSDPSGESSDPSDGRKGS
jgi:DNA replication protein DnaC